MAKEQGTESFLSGSPDWINIICQNFHFESFPFPKSEPSPCEAVLWKLVVNSANGINIINETKETLLINNGY